VGACFRSWPKQDRLDLTSAGANGSTTSAEMRGHRPDLAYGLLLVGGRKARLPMNTKLTSTMAYDGDVFCNVTLSIT
jgi:hypothetical protein